VAAELAALAQEHLWQELQELQTLAAAVALDLRMLETAQPVDLAL
jgi:hypothetical protein